MRTELCGGYDWRLLSANQSADAASFSAAIGCSLERAALRSVINDCWGGDGVRRIYVVRLPDTWSRRRDAPCRREGKGTGITHEEQSLSPSSPQPAFGLLFGAFLCRADEADFSIKLRKKIRRAHIVDWLYVARCWLVIGATRTWWEYRQHAYCFEEAIMVKSGKFTLLILQKIYFCNLISYSTHRTVASAAQRLLQVNTKTPESVMFLPDM